MTYNRSARGTRIAEVIKASGKSQREVAELVGVTPQSITKWLRTGNIYIGNLVTLAEIAGVDIRYLIYGDPGEGKEYGYEIKHAKLQTLVDQLDKKQARKLTLCAHALLECDDSDVEVNITVGAKKVKLRRS